MDPSESVTAECWAPVLRRALSQSLRGHDPLGRDLLERVFAGLSLSPAGAVGVLEFRLSSAPDVDVSFRVDPPSDPLHFEASKLGPHGRRLLSAWLADSRILAGAPFLWLELDAERLGEKFPEPVLCVRIAEGAEPLQTVLQLLPALHPFPIGPWRSRQLERLLTTLPPTSHLLYAFSLSARGVDAIRLELFDARIEPLNNYVLPLLPEGASDAWQEAVRLASPAERFHVSFDLGPEAYGRRFGLECSFLKQPQREPGWRRLLQGLVDADLCRPEKMSALIEWAGFDSPEQAGELWPRARPTGTLARCLSHVKLVVDERGRLEAKGYLLYSHQPDKRHPRSLDVLDRAVQGRAVATCGT